MRNFKEDFKAMKAANDWTKLNELWLELCQVAEVELSDDGPPSGLSAELAEYRNRQAAGNMQGGKKI